MPESLGDEEYQGMWLFGFGRLLRQFKMNFNPRALCDAGFFLRVSHRALFITHTSKGEKMKATTIIFIILFASAAPAGAALVTIAIEGVIDSVDDPYGFLAGSVEIGSLIQGTYTFESSTSDSNPDNKLGRYEHTSPYGVFLNIGGISFRTSPTATSFLLEIGNDYPSSDDYFVLSQQNEPLCGDMDVQEIYWILTDQTGQTLGSDELPSTAPAVEDWSFNFLSISGSDSDRRVPEMKWFNITGHVTTAYIVPEPATIFLLGAGMAFLRRGRRDR